MNLRIADRGKKNSSCSRGKALGKAHHFMLFCSRLHSLGWPQQQPAIPISTSSTLGIKPILFASHIFFIQLLSRDPVVLVLIDFSLPLVRAARSAGELSSGMKDVWKSGKEINNFTFSHNLAWTLRTSELYFLQVPAGLGKCRWIAIFKSSSLSLFFFVWTS